MKNVTRTIKTYKVNVIGIKDNAIVNATIDIPDVPEKKRDNVVREKAFRDGVLVASIGNYEEDYTLYACTEEEFLSVAHPIGKGRKSDAE